MKIEEKHNIIKVIEEIKATYGEDDIKSSIVSANMDKSARDILVKYGTKVTPGLYSLVDFDEESLIVDEVEVKAVVEPTQSTLGMTTDFFHTENLIPEINENYVEFGCFKPVLSIVKSKHFLPFYIQGESGNGKSEGVEQACAVAKRELVCCNVTNETTEEDLMGSFILSNGNMIWKDGPVLVAMRRGAVLLLDELDQITSTCMSLQSVLQNKPYYVKKTNEMVYPKPGFTIVGTANTKGDGDSGDRYVGANVLNEAFLERFNCVYEQDYPPSKVEMKILSKLCTDTNFLVGLVRWAGNIRENYKLNTISRCITTRRLVQIVRNYAVFQSQKSAIEYGINRFDKDTRSAMMDYYNNINNITYNDGLDEYLPKDAIRDTAISDEIENAVTESVAKTVKVNMNFGNPSIKEIASAMKAPTQKSDDYYNKLYTGTFDLPPAATKASVDRVEHIKKMYGNHDTSEKTINKAIDGLNRFNSEYLDSPYEDEHPSYKGPLWTNGRPI